IAPRHTVKRRSARSCQNVNLSGAVHCRESVQEAEHGLRAAVVTLRNVANIEEYARLTSVRMSGGENRFEAPLCQLSDLRLGEVMIGIGGLQTTEVCVRRNWIDSSVCQMRAQRGPIDHDIAHSATARLTEEVQQRAADR